MILFIFEGASSEPYLYEEIKTLFFPNREDQVLCSFCSNIYTFYKHLKDKYDGFADVVDVLKIELATTDPENELFNYKSADFESIYLFFDYDFYWGKLDVKNNKITELLEYFNEETENGRLFISYPMIESIQYTKELPDSNFYNYIVKRKDSFSRKFKKEAKAFCHYQGYAFLKDADNWKHLVQQNVFKANYLTKDALSWPLNKDDVEQQSIFKAQLSKHVIPDEEVAILNAFPLFLYYYFPKERFVTNEALVF